MRSAPRARPTSTSLSSTKVAYLGVCAGAYYAAPNYWWEGKYYAHPNLLGAYPVTLEGAIGSIAPWPGYSMTALSNGRNAIYYGGPTVGLLNTNPATLLGEKAASFASIDGQLPAVIVYNKLLLTSVHLEAFENDGISGLSTAGPHGELQVPREPDQLRHQCRLSCPALC